MKGAWMGGGALERGGGSESVKKGKFVTKILSSDNVEWSSKTLWNMISTDVKLNKTTKNKRSSGCIWQISVRSPLKIWNKK